MIGISVIIPLYNASALVNRCLDSVFSQSGNFEVEIIVIDDGSTDGSVGIIQSRPEPNIRLVHQKNQGPAVARNEGIKLAQGRYLAFIDADDYWLDGFFEKTVSMLENHDEVVAVNTGQKHITISGTSVAPGFLNGTVDKHPLLLDDFFSFWAQHNHVCTGSVMMRTDIVKRTQGQRKELRIYEDIEFWLYLSLWGKWAFIPEILFVSDGGLVTQQIGWLEKNRKRWASAPPIDLWERRIVAKLGDPIPLSYEACRGRIAKNLSYSILLSGRTKTAREQIRKYGSKFPKDRLSKLLVFSASNALVWAFVSRLLMYREYHRK